MTVDEAKRMSELATALSETVPAPTDAAAAEEAEAALAEKKLFALEELADLVESIDNAKNLFMVGGFGPLLDAIRGEAAAATTPAAEAEAEAGSGARLGG
jgi:hypothetical protein